MTLLMCAPPWSSTMAPSHPTIRITRSRLSLLRRCRTAAVATVRPQGPQTYRRTQPRALPKGDGPTTMDSLRLADEQAIHCWQLSRRPEYGALTRRTRSYQDPGQRDPEGKLSVGSTAAAGFYYDGRSEIFNSLISHSTQSFYYPTHI